MPISIDKLSQAFSLALEDRSKETQDLVTNSNVLLKVLEDKGKFKPYSGPTIRYRVQYAQTGTATWYYGYDYLNTQPADLVYDAEFTPKNLSVSPTLSGDDIRQNSGRNQLKDVFRLYIDTAQGELRDEVNRAAHSNGTGSGGKEVIGLQAAVPTDPTTGIYGGIPRSNTWWRTNAFDAQTAFPGIGTQVNSTTVRAMYESIVIDTSRGLSGADLILAAKEHYTAFSAGLVAIQRVTEPGKSAAWGFPSLKFAGVGRSIDVVLEGGIGTNMPSNVTYLLDTEGFEVRYHPDNFFKPWGGKQSPVNQDAIVQHLGFTGELCVYKPLHQSKLFDSNPSA